MISSSTRKEGLIKREDRRRQKVECLKCARSRSAWTFFAGEAVVEAAGAAEGTGALVVIGADDGTADEGAVVLLLLLLLPLAGATSDTAGCIHSMREGNNRR